MARRALAALLLALAAGHAHAEELGTLFYSPEERARLDRLRRGEPGGERSVSTPGAAAAPQALTGFVQRSDGRTTLWIDGNPVPLAGTKPAPKLDPNAVRNFGENADAVKIERKKPR